MEPKIEFRHVLGELSVNRNDPCEVVRELISNSYDAAAKKIFFAPLEGLEGFIFLDDGTGLDAVEQKNGITPWEAFFSIGKSTKNKGSGIGYKCQGSKLCFASRRILVASKAAALSPKWIYKIVDNPRNNLDLNYSIDPDESDDIGAVVADFIGENSSGTVEALDVLATRVASMASGTGTLIVIDGLDTENYGKYFSVDPKIQDSYVFNYIRYCTRHGDVRRLTSVQGFTQSQITQIVPPVAALLEVFSAQQGVVSIPFGFPYLDKTDSKEEVKSPQQISRLRDGRFSARAAKSFSVGGKKYSVVLAVDGNRRAHEEYSSLDRKGKAKSGIRLGDHRGAFVSVKGIKICKYSDLLSSIEEYSVLTEGDSSSHYVMVLDGDFDLVTNRNALSKKAYDDLSDPEFVKKVKEFLDNFKSKDSVFSELIARLRRESSENLLNEQIAMLKDSRDGLKKRQRLRFQDSNGAKHLVLAPNPGEEYLVGVLYVSLGKFVSAESQYHPLWKSIVTFSTQGIDSLALKDATAQSPLASENIAAVEYKYEFTNAGPFNHAIAVVDSIVAWTVSIDSTRPVKDTYTCFGKVRALQNGFTWEIFDVENDEAGEYPGVVTVVSLKELIERTFDSKFEGPA